jgi:flagellar L-ring protein precursor FlgH
VEVLPNGDMRVAAEKFVKINKEDERLSLSGIVRPRDVSSDNIVGSTFVGDLRLAINGKGVASDDNSPGWIWRLLDKISPF